MKPRTRKAATALAAVGFLGAVLLSAGLNEYGRVFCTSSYQPLVGEPFLADFAQTQYKQCIDGFSGGATVLGFAMTLAIGLLVRRMWQTDYGPYSEKSTPKERNAVGVPMPEYEIGPHDYDDYDDLSRYEDSINEIDPYGYDDTRRYETSMHADETVGDDKSITRMDDEQVGKSQRRISKQGPLGQQTSQSPHSTKYCRYCGATILRESKFCEECGKNLV